MNEDRMLTYDTDRGEVKLSPRIVRKYLVSGRAQLVTDAEIVLFMQLCRYQGLNPFLREAYLIKYSENAPATMVVGKDTFTKRAAGIKECHGWNAGVIVREQKNTYRTGSAVFQGEVLIGGWAEVRREGWQEPLRIEVSLGEYQKMREGKPVGSWAVMPATMIRKVALVQALRETFPDRFQGMYDSAEMIADTLPEAPVHVEGKPSDPPIMVEPEESDDHADEELNAAAEKGFEEGAKA